MSVRHLGVADVRTLGDELNRFGVLCGPFRRRVLQASAGCLVRDHDDGDALPPSGGDTLPPSLYGDLQRQIFLRIDYILTAAFS